MAAFAVKGNFGLNMGMANPHTYFLLKGSEPMGRLPAIFAGCLQGCTTPFVAFCGFPRFLL